MQKAWLFQLTNISSRYPRVRASADSVSTLKSDVEPSHIVSTSQDIIEKMMSVSICKPFSVSITPRYGFENMKHFADRQQALVSILSVESNTMLSNDTNNKFLLETYKRFKQKAHGFPDRIKLLKALLNMKSFIRATVLIWTDNISGRQAKFHLC